MPRNQSLNNLSPRTKVLLGLAVISLGLFTAAAVVLNPVQLRTPLWVALLACGSFVIAGTAIVLHGFVSKSVYEWIIVFLVTVMTAIPAWIALAPGERFCTASILFLSSEAGCRFGFGFATVLMLLMLGFVVRSALTKSHAD
jgi:hypothetical protein